jgi:hypothetical protein
MSSKDPIRDANRKVRRQERLGFGSFCLLCRYAHLEGLTRVSRRWLKSHGVPERIRRLLERHHIFGVANDPEVTVPLCLNCHREVTEGLACEGVSMRPSRNPEAVVASGLRASAVMFDSLARSYREWATLLGSRCEVEAGRRTTTEVIRLVARGLRGCAITFESLTTSFRNLAELLETSC